MGLLDALGDSDFRSAAGRGLLDAADRGVVGGLLGFPVDATTGAMNLGLAGIGYLGNKAGLLSADQMPQLIDKPVGGSEWFGQQMQDAGIVTPNRNPIAETLAGAALPGAGVKTARGLALLEDALPALVPSQGGPSRLSSQFGAMFPEGRARMLLDLQAGQGSGRYQLGDVTKGQAQQYAAASGTNAGQDVWMDDDALQHLLDARVGRDNFTPEEIVRFAQQAMQPRAKVWRDPAARGHKVALVNDGQLDAATKRRYSAQMPLRPFDDGLGVVSVIPRGLPGRNNKAPDQ